MKKEAIGAISLGLFCLLISGAFLVNAFLTIKKTEGVLLKVYEEQARGVIRELDVTSKAIFNEFRHIQTGLHEEGAGDLETGFALRERVFGALLEQLQEACQQNGGERRKDPQMYLIEQGKARGFVVVETGGRILEMAGSIPSPLMDSIRLRISGAQESLLLWLEESGVYLVARRDDTQNRWCVLVLDNTCLEFWGAKEALKVALEAIWRPDIEWIQLRDETHAFFHFGNLSEGKAEADLMKIVAPLTIHPRLSAEVCMDISGLKELRTANRRYVSAGAGIMASFSVFLTVLFYLLLRRHAQRVAQMKEALQRQERLSSLGRLAGGLAHEIKNPLNAISMALQRISMEFEPREVEKRQEFIEITSVVKAEIKRLTELVGSFAGASKQKMVFEVADLAGLLKELMTLLNEEARQRQIKITSHFVQGPLLVRMDYSRLYQAILNIFKNSMEAIGEKGEIVVETFRLRRKRLRLSIRDTGKGIDPEAMERIFEPGYTTKEKGLGLGLAIAREIIIAHGGEIGLESKSGEGAAIHIILPLAE